MLFGKRKEMVDIRDLPKNVSTGKSFIAKDGFGFVDLTKKRMLPSEERRLKMESSQSKNPSTVFPQQQPASSFNFFDTPTSSSFSSPSLAPGSDTEEMLRKISAQISDLDSKVYKMEQRIELLEKKAGISSSDSSNSSSGFSW